MGTVIDAIELTRGRFEALRPGVKFATDPQTNYEHDAPPRVNVSVPLDQRDTFRAPQKVGGNPRRLWTRSAAVRGWFWGVDIADAEDLFEKWVAAAHEAFTHFSYQLTGGTWVNLGSLGVHGALYIVDMVLALPVNAEAKGTVQPTTSELEHELDT